MSRKYIFGVTIHPNVLDKAMAWFMEETVWTAIYGMWPTSNLYKCFLVTKHPKYKYQMQDVRFIISVTMYDSMNALYSTNQWTVQHAPIWRNDKSHYPLYQSLVAPTAYGQHSSVLQHQATQQSTESLTPIVFRSDEWKALMRCDVHSCLAKKKSHPANDPRYEFHKRVFPDTLSEPPCEPLCESFFREWVDTQFWMQSSSRPESPLQVDVVASAVFNRNADSHVRSCEDAGTIPYRETISHSNAISHSNETTSHPLPIDIQTKHTQHPPMQSTRKRPYTETSVLPLISIEDELYAHYQVCTSIRWNWQCTIGNDRTIRDLTNVLDSQTSMYCLFVVETERRDQMLMGYIKLSYPNFAVQTILKQVHWIGDKRVHCTPVSKDEFDEAIRVTEYYEARHSPKIPHTLASGQCLSLLHAPIFHSSHLPSVQ